jgi:hypothetical protein
MPVAETTRSIQCRYCNCVRTRVYRTQIIDIPFVGNERTIIRRVRKCEYCGMQFNTVETYENEEHPNVPEIPVEFINLLVEEQTKVVNPLDPPPSLPAHIPHPQLSSGVVPSPRPNPYLPPIASEPSPPVSPVISSPKNKAAGRGRR